MLFALPLLVLGAGPQIPRLREDSVVYEIDPALFGTGVGDDMGLDSIVQHIDYITGLGISAVSIAAPADSIKEGDPAIREVKNADLDVLLPLGAKVSPKSIRGWMAPSADLSGLQIPEGKWIGGFSAGDAHDLVHAGGLSTVSDDRWRKDVLDFVRNQDVSPTQFEKTISGFRKGYGANADWLLLRLTPPTGPRIKGEVRGDLQELAQLWTMLFAFPGVPVLEYGDEIGMVALGDKMDWDHEVAQQTYLGKIQTLINLRRHRPSLYRGSYDVIAADDDNHIFGFARHDRFESTLVLFNNGDKDWSEQVSMAPYGPNPMTNLIDGTTYGQSLTQSIFIPAHGVVLMGN